MHRAQAHVECSPVYMQEAWNIKEQDSLTLQSLVVPFQGVDPRPILLFNIQSGTVTTKPLLNDACSKPLLRTPQPLKESTQSKKGAPGNLGLGLLLETQFQVLELVTASIGLLKATTNALQSPNRHPHHKIQRG